jgi:hypothetical protein
MKVLILQIAGEHEANRNVKEALNFKRAFERAGDSVVVCGPGYAESCVESNIAECDFILILENWNFDWIPDLSHIDKPKIFWSVDSHKALDAHKEFCISNCVDIVLCAVKPHVKLFQTEDVNFEAIWFPCCYPLDAMYPLPSIPKSHKIGFCGNWGNRKPDLLELQRLYGMQLDICVIGDAMTRAINSYMIHWNKNETINEINARTFETLGCGTFLLTQETDSLNLLFEPGVHLDTYTTFDECCAKIDYYMAHEDEVIKIAAQGHEQARQYHSYDARARGLHAIVMERWGIQ